MKKAPQQILRLLFLLVWTSTISYNLKDSGLPPNRWAIVREPEARQLISSWKMLSNRVVKSDHIFTKEISMSKRMVGFGLVIIGSLMQIISLSADYLGIGQDPTVIGWKQLLGAAIGLVVILVGVWFVSAGSAAKK
jgi:hypothetical protein